MMDTDQALSCCGGFIVLAIMLCACAFGNGFSIRDINILNNICLFSDCSVDNSVHVEATDNDVALAQQKSMQDSFAIIGRIVGFVILGITVITSALVIANALKGN